MNISEKKEDSFRDDGNTKKNQDTDQEDYKEKTGKPKFYAEDEQDTDDIEKILFI
ncbi:MAG: hypothetical protein JW827_06920 [Spirochaetes bacterium]|nr:hypothetical protein [Spirochaetota bacterium]